MKTALVLLSAALVAAFAVGGCSADTKSTVVDAGNPDATSADSTPNVTKDAGNDSSTDTDAAEESGPACLPTSSCVSVEVIGGDKCIPYYSASWAGKTYDCICGALIPFPCNLKFIAEPNECLANCPKEKSWEAGTVKPNGSGFTTEDGCTCTLIPAN